MLNSENGIMQMMALKSILQPWNFPCTFNVIDRETLLKPHRKALEEYRVTSTFVWQYAAWNWEGCMVMRSLPGRNRNRYTMQCRIKNKENLVRR